jgi:biopolymer transport protein ExbD
LRAPLQKNTVWENLHDTLRQVLENRTEKVIVVKANRQVAFAQLVRVIDTCRSVGANVILPAR